MTKLQEKVKNYFKKRKTVSIILDFLFYLIILSFLIPGTRKTVLPFFMRAVLHPPLKKISTAPTQKVSDKDFQWPLEKMDGSVVKLDRFRNEVLFINLWATWCPPCRAEMPSIQKLYDDYGDKVRFLMIVHDNPGSIRNFIRDNHYTFPVYLQKYEAPEVFSTNSIPTTFIVDSRGNIVLKHKGASKWNSRKIRRLLDELLREKGNNSP